MKPDDLFRVLLLAVACALAGCVADAGREPVNLTTRKAELMRYEASGEYARGLAAVAEEASRWIEARAARRTAGERLAVVFDVDETVLSNFANMERDDFAYIAERWHAWVDRAEAKAIVPVRETYEAAKRAEVAVIFLTGRRTRDLAATRWNLEKEQMGVFEELIVRPERESGLDVWTSSAEFKAAQRKALTESGWTIIANIGDQTSDLAGGYSERNFKLPNPFYLSE